MVRAAVAAVVLLAAAAAASGVIKAPLKRFPTTVWYACERVAAVSSVIVVREVLVLGAL
jgi:hypothetical protein